METAFKMKIHFLVIVIKFIFSFLEPVTKRCGYKALAVINVFCPPERMECSPSHSNLRLINGVLMCTCIHVLTWS